MISPEERRRCNEADKLDALRAAVQGAIDQSERGERIELQPHEISGFIRQLGKEAAREVQRREAQR